MKNVRSGSIKHKFFHVSIVKNGVLKSIVYVIKHVNFQLYRVHPDGVI